MTSRPHFPFDGREVRQSRYLRAELCNFLHVALVYKYGPQFFVDSAICSGSGSNGLT